ncbi:MAG TPA: hypothetical protein VFJ98_02495 [Mycobacteriales bacterium]|nr:hypothetical protein [Mycobacteriales bacterium]
MSARPLGSARAWTQRGLVALAAVAAVATTGPSVASATTTHSRPEAAAGWLARQLAGSGHDHIVAFGSAQAGATADAVLSMDAAGVAQDAARRATHWLATHAKSYATSGSGYDPGRLAKLLLVAEAQRANVHGFGGIDLVRELRGAEQPSGAFTNTADAGSGDNPVSQALALIALSHTGSLRSWPDAAAIGWLVGQQCGDGGFMFSTQTTPANTCTDVDSTGIAAQALLTVHSSAAADAVHWVRAHRNSDGGYGLAFGSNEQQSNTNSTAVAVQTLLQAGSTGGYGLSWLRRHQIGCSGLASRRGALKYDDTKFEINSATFATAQAGQALAKRWLGDISRRGAVAEAPRLAC